MPAEGTSTQPSSLAVLYRLVTLLNGVERVEDLYEYALDAIRDALGVPRSSILLFDEAGVMRFVAWRGLSTEYRAAVEGHSPWRPDEPNPQPVLVGDAILDEHLAPYSNLFISEGIGALAFIPLVNDGRLLGKFMLYYGQPHDFTEEEILLASSIAGHVATAAARQQVKRTLAESELRLRMALSAAQIGVWEWRIAGNNVQWSDRVYEIHGWVPDGRPCDVIAIRDSFHPEDVDRVVSAVRAAVESCGSYRIEFRIRRPSGEIRWIDVAGAVICDSDGRPARVLGTTVDITERKHREEERLENDIRLDLAMEAGKMGAWGWNIRTGAVSWSPSLERIHGLQPGTFSGTFDGFLRDIHPQDRDRVVAVIDNAVRSRTDYSVQYRITTPDGEERWIEARGRVFVNSRGEVERMGGVCQDITERKRMEVTRERLARIIESSDDAIISNDLQGIITSWNRGAERIFGYTAAEVTGRPVFLLAAPDIAYEMPAIVERIRRGEYVDHYETRRKRKDGRIIHVALTISPVRDAAGDIVGVSKIARDITERKLAENALRKANENLRRVNEDLRQFSYAASHDLKEPLRQMSIYAELLATEYKSSLDPVARTYLDFCIAAARRMHGLVSDLRAYIDVDKAQPAELQPVEAGPVLQDVLENLRVRVAETGAQISAGPLPAVSIDRAHLLQLLQNIIDNALKYHHADRPPVVQISAQRQNRDWVFAISDNGIGIAPEYHQRIFEVFKRLHSDRPGTGIGLAICQKIVERYGGRIWVSSQPGAGSTFFFALPVAP